jgi:hypothetical protein
MTDRRVPGVRREVLECFLIDGRVEIDSNIIERAIRPQTITRKASIDRTAPTRCSAFASTRHPSRDLALRYANGSAPAPVAHTANPGTTKGQSELRAG